MPCCFGRRRKDSKVAPGNGSDGQQQAGGGEGTDKSDMIRQQSSVSSFLGSEVDDDHELNADLEDMPSHPRSSSSSPIGGAPAGGAAAATARPASPAGGAGPGRDSVCSRKHSVNAFKLDALPARHHSDHGRVEIVEWQKEWAGFFEEDSRLLKSILGDAFVAAHHVGSTSIKGLVAKNIVDLLLVVDHLHNFDHARAALEDAGYVWCGEPVPGGRYMYCMHENDTHVRCHVHVTPYPLTKNSEAVLMFRDALRANPTWRSEYALLKLNLASAHADDRIAYNKKKTDFIKSTLKAHRAQLQQAKAAEQGGDDVFT